ncbi:MAG: hypothetical protein J5764_06330, partial [Bacteroidales bacterium]|nr:hypothetical protein [Bacteroidales bacterium]
MKPSGKYGSLPDSELVAAVRQGDGGAFDTLFLRWYPQVCRFLSALVANPVLAEDLAQQVFIKLWLFRERLDPSKSLKNFIFVLSRNAAMDMFRAERAMDKKGLSAAADSPSQDRT